MTKITPPGHDGWLATFSGIARALKTTETELRSVLRGKNGKYIQPVHEEPGGLYRCSDIVLFTCIYTLRSAMSPAQREDLQKRASRESAWKDADRSGADSKVWLFIPHGNDRIFLGHQEVWAELCNRRIYGGAVIYFEPAKLNVGETSETIHSVLRGIAKSYPSEVMFVGTSAVIAD